MEVFYAELWAIGLALGAIGLALGATVYRRARQQQHGVNTVALFSESQAAIQLGSLQEPGPWHR